MDAFLAGEKASISGWVICSSPGEMAVPQKPRRRGRAFGMIPGLPDEKFVALGNSSLKGAVLALTSRDAYDRIESIRNRVTYLELNVNQEFSNIS